MPNCIRRPGAVFACVVTHCTPMLQVQVSPLALQAILWRCFSIFLISKAICIGVFVSFYPETKRKTLEKVDARQGHDRAKARGEGSKAASGTLKALFGDEVGKVKPVCTGNTRTALKEVVEAIEAGKNVKDEKQRIQHLKQSWGALIEGPGRESQAIGAFPQPTAFCMLVERLEIYRCVEFV